MVRLIKLVGRAETPLLVSAGKAGDLVEPLAVKTAEGKLVYVIPSSSWRGVFRATSLRIAPHVFNKDSVERFALEKHHYESLEELGESGLKEVADHVLGAVPPEILDEIDKASLAASGMKIDELRKEDPRRAVDVILNMTCPLERLYGSNYAASKLIFLDTYIDRAAIRYVDHVGIDRKTGVKRAGVLFTEGALVPVGDLEIDIVDRTSQGSSERRLLEKTLEALRGLGVQVGSSKSRGLGLVVIRSIEYSDIT